MRKTDARIRYTQGVLKQALLSFLKEKPINKITVKEVCERAELNRATFYAHYSDCFALLESIEEDLLEAFQQSLKLVDSFDVTALIEAIYTMIERQQERYGWEFLVLGANIDAAREAARFGIRPDRAVNYRCDRAGTALNYEVIGDAVCSVRACEPLTADWKRRIEADRRERG